MIKKFLYNIFKEIKTLVLYPRFIKNYFEFKKDLDYKRFAIKKIEPYLQDKTENTNFDRHYIYHPAWAARVLAKTKPEEHVDISSTLHFSTLASAFVPIKFYDYRPADLKLNNLKSAKADLCDLHFKDNSIPSLSCMHTVEHIGLGRYGDPIDPDGDLKAIKELERVLAENGDLLFVVPIGAEAKIWFNAHRIFSYKQVVQYFPNLKLHEFTLIPEDPNDGALVVNPDKELMDKQVYACGCFWFKKLSD